MEDKDSKTGRQNYSFADQTKTLWLAASYKDQRTNLLPFGWLLVEIFPEGQAQTEWPELHTICSSQHQQTAQWAGRYATEKQAFAAKRQADEQRREREETERQQRETEAQARLAEEQAEKIRLASLSEEQKLIEKLRQTLCEKQANKIREQIGGALYTELHNLISQAATWSADDKVELLQVGKELLVFIGADGNKKAKELLRTLT